MDLLFVLATDDANEFANPFLLSGFPIEQTKDEVVSALQMDHKQLIRSFRHAQRRNLRVKMGQLLVGTLECHGVVRSKQGALDRGFQNSLSR